MPGSECLLGVGLYTLALVEHASLLELESVVETSTSSLLVGSMILFPRDVRTM
jgi:hypothetical protein